MSINQLGKIIKKIRLSKKWTQKDLSEKTGFSQNTISNHENGNRTIGEKEVSKYAEAFNLNAKYIYEQLDDLYVKKETQVTQKFAHLVIDKINNLDIPLEDVAKEVDVSFKKIESIASGYIEDISINKLLELCKLLNISPDFLFRVDSHEKTYEEYLKAKEISDFIHANFSSLSFKSKQSVYDFFVYELNKTKNDGDQNG